jgi:hypothetical protein
MGEKFIPANPHTLRVIFTPAPTGAESVDFIDVEDTVTVSVFIRVHPWLK